MSSHYFAGVIYVSLLQQLKGQIASEKITVHSTLTSHISQVEVWNIKSILNILTLSSQTIGLMDIIEPDQFIGIGLFLNLDLQTL